METFRKISNDVQYGGAPKEIMTLLEFDPDTGDLIASLPIMRNGKYCYLRVMTPDGFKPMSAAYREYGDKLPMEPGHVLPEQTSLQIT